MKGIEVTLTQPEYIVLVKQHDDYAIWKRKDTFLAASHAREEAIGTYATEPDHVIIVREVHWQTKEVTKNDR